MQLDVAALAPADRLVVGVARVLPGARQPAVVEARLAVERHLDLAVHAADQPHQHVVGVVVGRRAPVRVRALVLVVPGADQQDVADDDPAAARAPARLQDVRAGQVAPRRRAPGCRPAPSRNVPASRSSSAPNTLGESKRGRQSHSMFELGATSAQVSQSDRKPYSAIGGNVLAPAPVVGRPLAHRRAAAAGSSSTVTFPSTSEAGADGSGGPLKARATASALSAPVTRKTIRREPFTTGSVRVILDTKRRHARASRPRRPPGRARRARRRPGTASRCARPGRGRAGSGRATGSPAASYSRSYSAAPSTGPSSPFMRWTVAPDTRDSRASSAMRKFECSWSGGTQRSSREPELDAGPVRCAARRPARRRPGESSPR